jgi:hypothetical protein
MDSPDPSIRYENVLILESRDWWEACRATFRPDADLVLTYDMGLLRDIRALGGRAFYVDHLVDNVTMHENNFLIYDFFRRWHLDRDENDIFTYRGIPFGLSFRLYIWDIFVFYIRARICLEKLSELRYKELFVGTQQGIVESILGQMAIPFSIVERSLQTRHSTYFFPNFKWRDEKTGRTSLAYRIADALMLAQGAVMSWGDALLRFFKSKPLVFVQEYHPTRAIIRNLRQDPTLRVVHATFSRLPKPTRYIPIYRPVSRYRDQARIMLSTYDDRRVARLILANGLDITEEVRRVIMDRVAPLLPEVLRDLDSIIDYTDRHPIDLEILIGNIGKIAPLVDAVCRSRGIPSYLIVNGLLTGAFMDEGKYATIINAYSISIKENYFRGMSNIVCLGDPRMDDYALSPHHQINRLAPTVTIGASGHNNTDLNSYLAVEFEFMFDTLTALAACKAQGRVSRIIIKVRPNGYKAQYLSLIDEYFPGLVDEVLDNVPMKHVLERTDLYISIYSQTVFEASCLRVPSLYYKKDTEIVDPPFDGKSELVTATSVEELIAAITDFCEGHPRFGAFLEKPTMEKYIGPLDGKNLERNLNQIYDMIAQAEKRRAT